MLTATNTEKTVAVTAPAFLALCSLVVIQVSVGLIYKASQTGDSYRFSQASALAIAEFTKFLISASLYSLSRLRVVHRGTHDTHNSRATSWKKDLERLSPSTIFGFSSLAVVYTINNHLSFKLFLLADPGTIQLLKSGSTCTTALIRSMLLEKHQTRSQWLAILCQICGLIMSQYQHKGSQSSLVPRALTLYPLSTYFFLVLASILTAVSGVWNEYLCTATPTTHSVSTTNSPQIHLQNTVLYLSGALTNLLLHLYRLHDNGCSGSPEPAFFHGYDSLPALLVVVSNVAIGLAITLVYTLANSVIKCFATSFSTGCLLILSSFWFGVPLTWERGLGSLIVFGSTYSYLMSSCKSTLEHSDPGSRKKEVKVG